MKRLQSTVWMLVLTACWTSEPQTDSKSHWLRECSDGSDCDSGDRCVCGVCTVACERASTCEREGGPQARCFDPAVDGVASECAAAEDLAGDRICLAECARDRDCASAQRCLQGACLPRAALTAEGDADGPCDQSGACGTGLACREQICRPAEPGDAGSAGDDAATANAGQPDAGVSDSGAVDTGAPPITGGALGACVPASADRAPCGAGCEPPLVCHVDDTCIEPWACDDDGVASLGIELQDRDQLLAIDAAYVYVARETETESALLRWPLAGGPVEQVFGGASAPGFVGINGRPPVLLLDGDLAYFLGISSPGAPSYYLYTVPLDGSEQPAQRFEIGPALAQDATHVYFSSPAADRLLRAPKSDLQGDGQEELFVAGPGLHVDAVAVNATLLFVVELGATSPRLYAISTSAPARPMPMTGGFTTQASWLHASADYLVAGDYELVERLQLARGEVLALADEPGIVGFWNHEDEFYYTCCDAAPNLVRSLHRVSLADAASVELLTDYDGARGEVLVSEHGVFVQTRSRLLRIVDR